MNTKTHQKPYILIFILSALLFILFHCSKDETTKPVEKTLLEEEIEHTAFQIYDNSLRSDDYYIEIAFFIQFKNSKENYNISRVTVTHPDIYGIWSIAFGENGLYWQDQADNILVIDITNQETSMPLGVYTIKLLNKDEELAIAVHVYITNDSTGNVYANNTDNTTHAYASPTIDTIFAATDSTTMIFRNHDTLEANLMNLCFVSSLEQDNPDTVIVFEQNFPSGQNTIKWANLPYSYLYFAIISIAEGTYYSGYGAWSEIKDISNPTISKHKQRNELINIHATFKHIPCELKRRRLK
jgi:hypothetical protein